MSQSWGSNSKNLSCTKWAQYGHETVQSVMPSFANFIRLSQRCCENCSFLGQLWFFSLILMLCLCRLICFAQTKTRDSVIREAERVAAKLMLALTKVMFVSTKNIFWYNIVMDVLLIGLQMFKIKIVLLYVLWILKCTVEFV